MRILIATLALTLPAAAQDTAMWAGTGCQLVPVTGSAEVAQLRCRNVLNSTSPFTEGTLTAGGLDVGLSILHTPGGIPDEFTVTPPIGFVAVPPVLVLGEGAAGVVAIVPWLGF